MAESVILNSAKADSGSRGSRWAKSFTKNKDSSGSAKISGSGSLIDQLENDEDCFSARGSIRSEGVLGHNPRTGSVVDPAKDMALAAAMHDYNSAMQRDQSLAA